MELSKVSINCLIKNNCYSSFNNTFDKIIDICSNSKVQQIEFTFDLRTLDFNEIKQILRVIASNASFKDPLNDSIITLILVTGFHKNLSSLTELIKNNLVRLEVSLDSDKPSKNALVILKKLISDNLPITLRTEETDCIKIMELYKNIKTLGIPLDATNYESSNESITLKDFIKWAYDVNGTHINLYTDLVNHIMLNYWGTSCKHKSCLGKYFTIDFSNSTLYACKKPLNKIGNVFNFQDFNKIFNTYEFIKLLEKAIDKRKACKYSCCYFNLCLGSCLFESYCNDCREKTFFELHHEIHNKLKNIVIEENFLKLNSALAEIILSCVASGKLSEYVLINDK